MPSKAETLQDYSSIPVSAIHGAASLRAPMRGETLPITVTTTSRRFKVPDGTGAGAVQWKNRHVHMYADGADVFIQVSTGSDAFCDETTRATEVDAGGTITITPSTNNGCWRIPNGTWIPVKFEATALTFALKGTGACVLRTHIAET